MDSNETETTTTNTDLHYLVFNNDLKGLSAYLDKNNGKVDVLSQVDNHGNTALHLAVMLGRHECVKRLIKAGAVVKKRNKQFWTPLHEAISYGDRTIIKVILEKYDKEIDKIVEAAKPKIVSALEEMIDFYVEIKWDFETWIPLLSRFLPSDLCKIHKKGAKIRIDCTLGDFAANDAKTGNSNGASPLNWQRGDLTFIMDLSKIGHRSSIVFLDNKKKIYKLIDKDINVEHDIEKEMDIYLSREMAYLKLHSKTANFQVTQIGWFSKSDKIESVNGYMCKFYDVSNLFVLSKMRNEHLTDDDIRKNDEIRKKLMKKGFTEVNKDEEDDDEFDQSDFDISHRPSLPPPPDSHVDWSEYINAPDGEHPVLGRKMRMKESKKEFKAQLAMSQEFPLSLNDLNKLLDALVPLAKFKKLKDFINAKLPPGFPVKIDIPVVPTVTAKVGFMNFKRSIQIDDKLFSIPVDYTEANQDF